MSRGWYNPRSGRRPRNWAAIRRRVLRRDRGVCQIAGPGCLGAASEVDHIVNNDDHSDGNLQSLCRVCHAVKTEGERRVGIRQANQRRYRPSEPHPGSVDA